MAESSRPWDGIVLGDCGDYTMDQWDDMMEGLYTAFAGATEGVLRRASFELNPTIPGANTVRIAAGAAIVKGKWYRNTADVDVAIPTPVADTRIDRIVLRSSWAAQTVRITRIVGTEGMGAPAITQVDGTTWDLKICQVSITIAGAMNITDERAYCHYATVVNTTMLDVGVLSADAAGRAKMASNYLSADATGWAKMASGYIVTTKIADNQVNVDKLGHNIDATGIAFNADMVDGYHGADLIAGGVIRGAIILWTGTLGGSDGHRPVVGGVPNEDWHLCNGELVGAQQTPDLQGRFVVGVGGGLGFALGATGGNGTVNFAHTHGAGTYATAVEPAHSHGPGSFTPTGTPSATVGVTSGGGSAGSSTHTHTITGTTAVDGSHFHAVAGGSASAQGNVNILNPYYALYYLCKVA